MICETCNRKMTRRRATVAHPYRYVLSGLPNVDLAGIVVWYCEPCGYELPEVPRVDELHRVIARILIGKRAALSGAEIRFLRKQVGFPANKFAALLGVSPEYLSRVETGKKKALGPVADRLARAIATVADDDTDSERAREILLQLADDSVGAGKRERPRTVGKASVGRLPLFRLDRGGWKRAA
jgi:putative transcriptional regulator